MKYNITELKSQTDLLHPSAEELTAEETRELLKDNFAESSVLRKDRKTTQDFTGLLGGVVDFTDTETVIAIVNRNFVFAFTGMEDGDVRHLAVQKAAGNVLNFTGTNLETYNPAYFNNLGFVFYRVSRKNSVIYVEPVTLENNKAQTYDIFDGINFLTGKVLYDNRVGLGNTLNSVSLGFTPLAFEPNWSGELKAKRDYFGNVIIVGRNLLRSNPFPAKAANLGSLPVPIPGDFTIPIYPELALIKSGANFYLEALTSTPVIAGFMFQYTHSDSF